MPPILPRAAALLLICLAPTAGGGAETLHEAARTGDVARVEALLAADATPVDARDADGRTALHWAAVEGHAPVAAALLEAGADVDAADSRNEYPGGRFAPLHYAAHFGRAEVAQVLIEAGADLDLANVFGRTPLQALVRGTGSVEVARLLVDGGADVDRSSPDNASALHMAAWYGRRELVDLLLDRGAALPTGPHDVRSTMTLAASRNLPGLFDLLYAKHGASIRETVDGGSFLIPAAAGGAVEVMRRLIADGVDPDGADRYGNRPLHRAASAGSARAVELLLEAGADVDGRDAMGRTAYNLAETNGASGASGAAALLRGRGVDTGPQRFPILAGAYLGQEPPGLTPRLFLPGIVSTPTQEHSAPVFAPGGDEVYWTPGWNTHVLFSRRENHRWSAPARAPFTGGHADGEPAFSVDGQRLLFLSTRPTGPGAEPGKENIWFVESTPSGWSEPAPLPETVNAVHKHWQISLAASGNLYFGSRQDGGFGRNDIYVSRLVGGAYRTPENLGPRINTAGNESSPWVAPDESYLIVSRMPTDGDMDLHISFRAADGKWTEATNMGPRINGPAPDLCPVVTPDGRYLFFLSGRNGNSDVWWVDAAVVDALRPQALDPERWAEAQRIHREATVIDAHAHAVRHGSEPAAWDLGRDGPMSQVDFVKLAAGGVDAVVYSIPLPGERVPEGARPRVLESAETLGGMVQDLSERGRLVRSPAELEATVAEGRIAALVSIEFRDSLGGTAKTVHEYREAGIRSITLAHTQTDRIADTDGEQAGEAGLSELGRRVVAAMNDAGILADISHVPDRLQREIAQSSRAPVVLSHTCARALNDTLRCVSDEVLRAVAEGGGVAAVTFYAGFASAEWAAQRSVALEEFAPIAEQIRARYEPEDEAADREVAAVWRGMVPLAPRVATLVDHIDHMVSVVGADRVGIGSDAGGSREGSVRDVQDATGWPMITYELLKRGYGEDDIEGILGGNLLRVYEQVRAAAR